jgi:hypothetical protein
VTASNHELFSKSKDAQLADSQRGASILEILLVVAIVALLSPFAYNWISDTSAEIRDIGAARAIMAVREPALNFVRLNQQQWPDVAQIKLDSEELVAVSDTAVAAFVDKYSVRGAIITDIYMSFNIDGGAIRAARIAKHIGPDAATVAQDGVAYGESWAAAAPDFEPGDLVYRINYNFSGDDNSKYLHRGTSGEDDFNVMQRNLNMGGFEISGIGTARAQSGRMYETYAAFAQSAVLSASSAYFPSGANADGSAIMVGSLRVNGDITGFRNIYAGKLNREGFSTTGSVVADRAKINNSITVGRNLNIKSDVSRGIAGFSGISTHSLATPYVSADEMSFAGNFGLTVSGELLMSTTAPIRVGNWSFPSNSPPKFAVLELSRAALPVTPSGSEFGAIMKSGWQSAQPKQ